MKKLTLVLLLFSQHVFSQQLHWKNIETHVDASFRGLSVVDDNIAWVSGSNGWIGRSTDGGNTWNFVQVKNFEKNDFRSLYAFDALNAVIANAGHPAYILRTNDGGQNWNIVYKNEDTSAFFDGIDFWNNKEGIIYGDPILSRMLLLKTNDGGKTWHMLPKHSRPELEKGEASFAASGTGIRCLKDNKLIITTGGMESRVFLSDDKGITWQFVRSPILKGKSSEGIFSIAYKNDTAIVVGGDYKRDSFSKDNVYVLWISGTRFSWWRGYNSTRGYRECVEYISKKTAVAVGPTGTDISYDRGAHWKPLNDEKGYHVLRKSRNGKLIIAAGSKGEISLLKYGI